MPDAVTPALTPSQWSDRLDAQENPSRTREAVDSLEGVGFIVNDEPWLDDSRGTRVAVSYDSFVVYQPIPQTERHALAALCLWGQPFGFTRKDVQLLEWFAAVGPSDHPDLPRFASLAARIEALLPPLPPEEAQP